MTPTHLRLISFLEGVSFIILLGIAMPLKYVFDKPFLIPYAGMAHGVLFLLFLIVLIIVCHRQNWGIGTLLFGIVASVLPLMPFVFERYIVNKLKNDNIEV